MLSIRLLFSLAISLVDYRSLSYLCVRFKFQSKKFNRDYISYTESSFSSNPYPFRSLFSSSIPSNVVYDGSTNSNPINAVNPFSKPFSAIYTSTSYLLSSSLTLSIHPLQSTFSFILHFG